MQLRFNASNEKVEMDNTKVHACSYILTCLLQRLEDKHGGLISELKEGIEADLRSVTAADPDSSSTDIFIEALKILDKADQ